MLFFEILIDFKNLLVALSPYGFCQRLIHLEFALSRR